MSDKTPLERVVAKAGSQKALADLLGISKGAVNQWFQEGRQVPMNHVLTIVRHFGDVVTCEELRPDLDW